MRAGDNLWPLVFMSQTSPVHNAAAKSRAPRQVAPTAVAAYEYKTASNLLVQDDRCRWAVCGVESIDVGGPVPLLWYYAPSRPYTRHETRDRQSQPGVFWSAAQRQHRRVELTATLGKLAARLLRNLRTAVPRDDCCIPVAGPVCCWLLACPGCFGGGP